MEKLRYYTRGSGWNAFKSKPFWGFFFLGAAITLALYISSIDYWYAGLSLVLIALVILTCRFVMCQSLKVYVYDTAILIKQGVFHRTEKNISFLGVLFVKIDQSFAQRIFRFGDVYLELIDSYDKDKDGTSKSSEILTGIISPKKFKHFIETRMAKKEETTTTEEQ